MKELIKAEVTEFQYDISHYDECSGGVTNCNKYCNGPLLCPERRTEYNQSSMPDDTEDDILF